MPVYEYACTAPDCEHRASDFRRIEFRNTPMHCDQCGGTMERAIERPNVSPDLEPYLDDHLVPNGHIGGPQYVGSKRHRRELMKQYGLQEAG